MAEHKLPYGKKIIDRLYRLGEILDYHCAKEHPVNLENESAVDVAWLFEAEQKYPLFIFEIESKTSSSIPSNPLKIFGETNQKFEKPLFLFHLLLSGGQESGKVQQLERTYGTYNYRIYRFSLKEEINLIKDILSQHRRLTNKLAITDLIIELIDVWKEIDVDSIILHIEALEFEKDTGNLLPYYAFLSRKIPSIKKHFIRRLKLKAEVLDGLYNIDSYDTYLGSNWAIPIHLGLLSAFANDGNEEKYFNDFKEWQEASSYLKMIGPSFGLSRDYDLFILGMSGAILSLTALLFYKVQNAKEYICGEILTIVEKSFKHGNVDLFNSVWLIHLPSNLKRENKYFDFVRQYINENGGAPNEMFLNPPTNFVGMLEDDETFNELGQSVFIPDWNDFKKMKKIKWQPSKLFLLALNYLLDEDGDWNPIRAGLL